MADEVYVPLSTVLAEDFWPTDYFGSVDFSFLDRIAYVNGAIKEEEDSLFDFNSVAGWHIMGFDDLSVFFLCARKVPSDG